MFAEVIDISHGKRLNISDGTYFATLEAAAGIGFFSDAQVRIIFEDYFKKNQIKYRYSLIGIVFYEQQAGVLLKISDISTGKIMQGVLSGFTKKLNTYLGQPGRKFRDRYKALAVKDEYAQEILSEEPKILFQPHYMDRFARRKGRSIDHGAHKTRVAILEAKYSKLVDAYIVKPSIREARNAFILLLKRHTLLTNRAIAIKTGLSESMVSKIISRESLPEIESELVVKCEEMLTHTQL